MTDEIREQLSKLGKLRLLSRSAVDRFREGDVKRLGSALGAGSVVEGSVRLEKDRVRVAVELIDTETEQLLWSEQYERRLEDVFAVQGDVALQIATALRATLGAGERQQLEKRPTGNLEAYQIYLRSQELIALDRQQNARAISLLKDALALDPRFAVAQARLAYRTVFSAYYEEPEKNDAGLELARKAIEIDPNLPDAHATLATAYATKVGRRRRAWRFKRRSRSIRIGTI